jgi:RNA polymerase sigma-70 factor, ECF subfamily
MAVNRAHHLGSAVAQVVHPAAFADGPAALVAAVRHGNEDASARLYDRYAPRARRVLMRCLGSTDELGDALQDVFVEVFRSLGKLQEPSALEAWITRIAVFVARARIRRRSRTRWLRLFSAEAMPDPPAAIASPEVRAALDAIYRILDTLTADERIAFALRFVEGMALNEVAAACDCSLATVKRRLDRAQKTFVAHAAKHPDLVDWLKGGARWS